MSEPSKLSVAALHEISSKVVAARQEVSRAILTAIDNVAGRAAASREVVHVLALGTVDSESLCAALLADINGALARKVAALEAEAVVADAILAELIEADEGAAVTACTERLETALAQADLCPAAPVEPLIIDVVPISVLPLSLENARVCAPRPPRLSDVVVSRITPALALAFTPGRLSLVCSIALGPGYEARGPEDTKVALHCLAQHTTVGLSVRPRGLPLLSEDSIAHPPPAASLPVNLTTTLIPHPTRCCVNVFVTALRSAGDVRVPPHVPGGSEVWLESAAFAGQQLLPVASASEPHQRLLCRVSGPLMLGRGSDTPRCVDIATTPCVTATGALCVPQEYSRRLHVLGGGGGGCGGSDSPWVGGIPVATLGLSQFVRAVGYCPREDLLLAADADDGTGRRGEAYKGRIVAVEGGGFGHVRWATPRGAVHLCTGLAVLPATAEEEEGAGGGFVAVSSAVSSRVYLHSLRTGARTGEAVVAQPFLLASVPAAETWAGHACDPRATLLFVSGLGPPCSLPASLAATPLACCPAFTSPRRSTASTRCSRLSMMAAKAAASPPSLVQAGPL